MIDSFGIPRYYRSWRKIETIIDGNNSSVYLNTLLFSVLHEEQHDALISVEDLVVLNLYHSYITRKR